MVVSTGGGAYINENTRKHIKRGGPSNADLDVLWERVNKRDTRPLLKTENPRQTLENLMNARYPIYAQADLTVLSRDVKKETMVEEVLAAITAAAKKPDEMTMTATAPANARRTVRVDLSDRSYDILIGPGLIAAAGREIASRLKGRKIAVVTDAHVAPLYLDNFMAAPGRRRASRPSLSCCRPAKRRRASNT